MNDLDSYSSRSFEDGYDRIVLVEKIISASPDKVWAAWEGGDRVEKWWQPKSDYSRVVVDSYDFRPGGAWAQHSVLRDGGMEIGKANPGVTFKEIVPYEKIVTVPHPIEGEFIEVVPEVEETIITFERMDDDKTKVAVSVLSSAKEAWQLSDTAHGVYSDILNNLAAYLEAGP